MSTNNMQDKHQQLIENEDEKEPLIDEEDSKNDEKNIQVIEGENDKQYNKQEDDTEQVKKPEDDIEQVKNFVKDIINGVNDEKGKKFEDTYNQSFIESHYDDIVKNILYNEKTKLQLVDSFLFITAKEKRNNMLITLAQQLKEIFYNFKYNKEDFWELAREEERLRNKEAKKIEEEWKKNGIIIEKTNIKNNKRYLDVKNSHIIKPNTDEQQKKCDEEKQKKNKILENFFQECKNISKIKWGKPHFCSCCCDYNYGINLNS